MGFPDEKSLSPSARNTVVTELALGLDSVDKLANLLQLRSPESCPPGTATAALLVEEIKGTISKAMAELSAGNMTGAYQVDSPSSVTDNKQCTVGKRKMQSTRTTGYRKRGSPYSYSKITSTNFHDGYTWRKYGQKDIFSSKYPRSYFRCTYKFDRGCKASKQVQRSEEDPSLFTITYFGEHTCVDEKKKVIHPPMETCIISFESKNVGKERQALSSLPALKQESEEEVLSNVSSTDSPSDYFVSTELEFNDSGMEKIEPQVLVEDDKSSSEVLPCFNNGMDLVDFMDFVDFDLFSLDHTDFFQD